MKVIKIKYCTLDVLCLLLGSLIAVKSRTNIIYVEKNQEMYGIFYTLIAINKHAYLCTHT